MAVPSCHPDRECVAHGLCESCYRKRLRKAPPGIRQPNRANPGRVVNPAHAPTVRPSVADIGWMAGFWEGEGSVKCNPGSASIQVLAFQKDPEVLHKLRAMVGGKVYQSKYSFAGLAGARYGDRKPVAEMWTWYVCGARARGFLFTIFRFLSERRKIQIRRTLAGRLDEQRSRRRGAAGVA